MKPISPYIQDNLEQAMSEAEWASSGRDDLRLVRLDSCLDCINIARRLVKEERKLVKEATGIHS